MTLFRHIRLSITFVCVMAVCAPPHYGQTTGRSTAYLTYEEAQPILNALDEVLPAELKGKKAGEQSVLMKEAIVNYFLEKRVIH